jgi:bifunctional DNA-binding transcriptional regulator/antitoxin component of YhaV-PrlF toxin-antitoxin module
MSSPHRESRAGNSTSQGSPPNGRAGSGYHASAVTPGPRRGKPGAGEPARSARTAAQGVVAALGLPALRSASPQPIRPLPLFGLHQLPRDGSLLYDIARVDVSGRVENRAIIKALGWQPGDRLETILAQGAIIIRASRDGLTSVEQRPRIIVLATARRRHGIKPGDQVLIAASPEHGLVIIYPLTALDEMIAGYHSTHTPTDDDHE